MCHWQERDIEVQGLQQRLTEAEEAHEEELVDLQATIQSCSAKLQGTKVQDFGDHQYSAYNGRKTCHP